MSHPTPPRSQESVATPSVSRIADRDLSPEAALARRMMLGRRARGQALGADLFGDVAWEILLHLFLAHERGEHISVAALPRLVSAPPGCAERWLLALETKGLAVTIGDAASGERMHVYLSGDAVGRMRTLLRSWL